MISRRRMLAAKMHLPLRQLALCFDCDEGFALGCPTCPACGGATLPSSDRSRRMVAKTDLRPQGRSVGDREPRDWTCAHFGVARADSTYGSRDHAAKARSWKAISKRLA